MVLKMEWEDYPPDYDTLPPASTRLLMPSRHRWEVECIDVWHVIYEGQPVTVVTPYGNYAFCGTMMTPGHRRFIEVFDDWLFSLEDPSQW